MKKLLKNLYKNQRRLVIGAMLMIFMASCGSSEMTPKVIDSKPSAYISADALKSEYEDNEVRADQQYKDKIIEVSGVVSSIGIDISDRPYVVLTNGERGIFAVQCFVTDKNRVAQLNKGDNIVVVGKGAGKMGNVILEDCYIK